MYIQQLYTNCLAEAAYYIESQGEAAIIDPLRETEPYLDLAASRGAKIKYIFETHFHADFVSGHLDLAAQTGATIVYGPGASPSYDVHVANDAEVLKIGKVSFRIMHTPGHTMESTCFVLRDESGKDHAVFTGDTLFVGAVGRPDLAVKGERPITPQELGAHLYDSLRNKVMKLADEVIVYPAHGAGSSCGKGIGKETWSTIGVQKATNYALQPMTKEEFVVLLTEDLPPPPPYFFDDARINQTGYDSIGVVMGRNLKALDFKDLNTEINSGATILDTRIPDEFEKKHIPGSINVGLNGSYAIWVGTLLPISTRLVIVAAAGKENESIMRLARVGFENVAGFVDGGIDGWVEAGGKTQDVRSITPEELHHEYKSGTINIVDVRKPSEFAEGHVKGALNLELDTLPDNLHRIPAGTCFLHCAGGYRSMIAASILKAGGRQDLVNIYGGFGAISKTGIPVETIPVVAR